MRVAPIRALDDDVVWCAGDTRRGGTREFDRSCAISYNNGPIYSDYEILSNRGWESCLNSRLRVGGSILQTVPQLFDLEREVRSHAAEGNIEDNLVEVSSRTPQCIRDVGIFVRRCKTARDFMLNGIVRDRQLHVVSLGYEIIIIQADAIFPVPMLALAFGVVVVRDISDCPLIITDAGAGWRNIAGRRGGLRRGERDRKAEGAVDEVRDW